MRLLNALRPEILYYILYGRISVQLKIFSNFNSYIT